MLAKFDGKKKKCSEINNCCRGWSKAFVYYTKENI